MLDAAFAPFSAAVLYKLYGSAPIAAAGFLEELAPVCVCVCGGKGVTGGTGRNDCA